MTIYPWQQQLWQNLIKQAQQGRLPHAILCLGPSGLGKAEFVKYFAMTLLCDQSKEVACGECRSCLLFQAGNHPDFYAVSPEEKSKSIKVDQVRELIAALMQTSARRGWQVALIHPAETMNRACSNALLKTLEEPSGQVVIILVANQLGTLPATLLSRCQRLVFTPPPIEEAQVWLQQQSAAALNPLFLLKISEGAPLRALAMAEVGYPRLRDQVVLVMRKLWREEILPTQVTTDLLKQDVLMVLRIMLSVVMDIMRMAFAFTYNALENTDKQQELQWLVEQADLKKLAMWSPSLLGTLGRLQVAAGINIQLALEAVLLQWQKVRKGYAC